MIGRVDLVARFVPQFHAAFGKTVAVPVDGRARFVAPHLDEVLLQVACGIGRDGADEFKFVDLGAPLLLIAGFAGAEVVADARAGREAVDTDHFGAFFGGRGDRKHAARAAADHENVRADRAGDVFFSDFGRLAEPVAVVFFGGLVGNHFHLNFAAGLRNALGGGLMHGLRGDARARNGVDVGSLGIDFLISSANKCI